MSRKNRRKRKTASVSDVTPRLGIVFDYDLLEKISRASVDDFAKLPGAQVVGSLGRQHIFFDNKAKILAVAHLDSVQKFLGLKHEVKDGRELVGMSVADDRLGVYVILSLLRKLGMEFDVLLTENEERGASTADDFKTDKEYNWMFMFDRSSSRDVVMYQYETPDLCKKLEACGFVVGLGSYSCIADLSHLKCAGFNFGTAYFNGHSTLAYFIPSDLKRQIERFKVFYDLYKDTRFASAAGNRYSRFYGGRSSYRWYDDYYGGYGGYSGGAFGAGTQTTYFGKTGSRELQEYQFDLRKVDENGVLGKSGDYTLGECVNCRKKYVEGDNIRFVVSNSAGLNGSTVYVYNWLHESCESSRPVTKNVFLCDVCGNAHYNTGLGNECRIGRRAVVLPKPKEPPPVVPNESKTASINKRRKKHARPEICEMCASPIAASDTFVRITGDYIPERGKITRDTATCVCMDCAAELGDWIEYCATCRTQHAPNLGYFCPHKQAYDENPLCTVCGKPATGDNLYASGVDHSNGEAKQIVLCKRCFGTYVSGDDWCDTCETFHCSEAGIVCVHDYEAMVEYKDAQKAEKESKLAGTACQIGDCGNVGIEIVFSYTDAAKHVNRLDSVYMCRECMAKSVWKCETCKEYHPLRDVECPNLTVRHHKLLAAHAIKKPSEILTSVSPYAGRCDACLTKGSATSGKVRRYNTILFEGTDESGGYYVRDLCDECAHKFLRDCACGNKHPKDHACVFGKSSAWTNHNQKEDDSGNKNKETDSGG